MVKVIAGGGSPGPTPPSSSLLAALGWLAGSLGLTGAFYASGFIIETSYQTLLGVEIIDPANRIYLRSAAGFWLALSNSFLAFANSLAETHPTSKDFSLLGFLVLLLVASVTIALIVLGFVRAQATLHAARARLTRWLGPIVLVLAVLSIAYFDLPLAHMTRFLVLGSDSLRRVSSHSPLGNHVEAFAQTLWCVRAIFPQGRFGTA